MNEIAKVSNGNGETSLVNFIQRAALDDRIDVTKLEALLRMQRDVVHEQAKREFNAAMAATQREMLPVVRDSRNSHIGNKYAKLETIDAQMRPIYTEHGFSVRYGSAQPGRDGWLRITCTVAHAGGYFEDHYLDAPLDSAGTAGKASKTGVQAVGSSVTYLRRYLLSMVFNIVLADDDDGEGARGVRQPSRPESPPPRNESPLPEPVRATAQSARAPSPAPTTAEYLGDDLPEWQPGPEYVFQSNKGSATYPKAAEWLERWRRLADACRLTNALDKLRLAAEMNEEALERVAAFDPEAAAEVRETLAMLLEPAASPGETAPPAEPDPEMALP